MATVLGRHEAEDCQDARDMWRVIYAQQEQIDALMRTVDALRESSANAVGEHFAECVEIAVAQDMARPIIDALADEIRAHKYDGRTLVTLVTRALAQQPGMLAKWPTKGTSDVPLGYARYLAERVPGGNRWGSHVTRRVHTMLDWLKVNP